MKKNRSHGVNRAGGDGCDLSLDFKKDLEEKQLEKEKKKQK